VGYGDRPDALCGVARGAALLQKRGTITQAANVPIIGVHHRRIGKLRAICSLKLRRDFGKQLVVGHPQQTIVYFSPEAVVVVEHKAHRFCIIERLFRRGDDAGSPRHRWLLGHIDLAPQYAGMLSMTTIDTCEFRIA